jgi:hypothetical protein
MTDSKFSLLCGKATLLLGGALALAGCVGSVNPPSAGVYVAPPVVEVAAPADYIYYPGYDVYFNSSIHQYAYLDGGAWVSRPEPRGVSINVLLASPSVRMDFHDSPANHEAEMARQYPRNWTPSGGHQVQNAPVRKAPVATERNSKAQVKKATPKVGKRPEQDEAGVK